jgi:hypothetical protein
MTVNTSSFSREQIVASYINVYFPDDITGTTELDPWYTLLSGISALPNKSVMLEKAMAATSCIYLGKINDDTRMLNHGLQLYNGAIHRVSQELSRNNYTDELFFTMGIFTILVVCRQVVYQLLKPPNANQLISNPGSVLPRWS